MRLEDAIKSRLQKSVRLLIERNIRYFEPRCILVESIVFELQDVSPIPGQDLCLEVETLHRSRKGRLQRGNKVLVKDYLKPLSVTVLLWEEIVKLEPIIANLQR